VTIQAAFAIGAAGIAADVSVVAVLHADSALITTAAAGASRGGQPPDGKQIYATTCAACHQPNGTGLSDVYPPLAESEWVTGDEDRLIRVVLHGLTGEIEVAGETVSGAMPAWGAALDDAQIAAVLTYVRSSWGNGAPPVSAATVARTRLATAKRATPWTAGELSRRSPPPR
jgi:mono/diheme cytochrome c family protein